MSTVLVFLLAFCGMRLPLDVAAQTGAPYQDWQGQFAFMLPYGWEQVRPPGVLPPRVNPGPAVFVATDTPAEVSQGFLIEAHRANGLTAADFVYAPTEDQTDVVKTQDITVGGIPARQFTMQRTTQSGLPLLSTLFVEMVHNGTWYIVSFTFDPADPAIVTSPIVQTVLGSWQFTN